MRLIRSYVYRLEPTPEQEAFLAQTAGACRSLYNLALEQRMMWKPGRPITLQSQCREIADLRAQVSWMRAAPAHALQSALKNLDRAFQNFFAGRAEYPRFKRKGDRDGFFLKDKANLGFKRLTRNRGAVRIPKVGWINIRGFRELGGELRNITISRRNGHWFAAIAWQLEVPDPTPSTLLAVGVDRGVKIFAALSTGENYISPQFFGRIEDKLANEQRKLARRKNGSARWRKQKDRVTRLHTYAANARRDFLHKTSLAIAKNQGFVAIEKLQVKNMSRSAKGTTEAPGRNVKAKSRLNRTILDKSWGMFRTLLAYKLAERGGELIEVPPEYTSQTCAACGTISKDSRSSQSEFVCVGCGHTANADTNAAINILRLGHSRRARQANHISGRQRELSKEAAHVAN